MNMRVKLAIAALLMSHLACAEIDYKSFLGQHDMVWDRVPDRWEVAPYTGNGNVGFLFYQAKGEAKNGISLHVGRHDYYDHRLPVGTDQFLWIYRSRLPLGHFKLESKGDITGIDLRLDLWNAELSGVVKTSQGSFAVHGLTHSESDVVYFETEAKDGESVAVSWHPDKPIAPVKVTLDAGGGPKGGSWDKMRKAPYPMPPTPALSESDGMQFCLQPLHQKRGETTTGWETSGAPDGRQRLIASIHHSFPEHDSLATVKRSLLGARKQLADGTFLATHRKWWHDYYPQSFLTINDAEKEAFYWIQMYKLVEFQTDENGLRIGKEIPFDKPHRHYSHLLGFYPLAVITPENEADKKMLRRSVDHWLAVSINSDTQVNAMPVTGYTATGAASMYATLGDAAKAYDYLDFFIQHKNVSPTTMCAEGNPVIESPLSFATCIHDMLLQSWGGRIRVFPGTPDKWGDVAFKDLRTQGAFLVSAKRKGGVTQFVTVESLAGSPCFVQTGIPGPKISINGSAATKDRVRQGADGMVELALKKGDTATFTAVALDQVDLRIEPIAVGDAERNLFGLSEKATRLPGHAFYHKEK